MDSQTIRTALGKLQVDPDSREEWGVLEKALQEPGGDVSRDELARLLDSARDEHAARGEWQAVSELLELELRVVMDTEREPLLLAERVRVLRDELFDDEQAELLLLRLLELNPDNSDAAAAHEEIESKRTRHQELEASYLAESEGAPDEVYRSSMLMRAVEMQVRYGGEHADLAAAADRLEHALRLDPTNTGAARLLEVLYRRAGKWENAAEVLERLTERADSARTRQQSGIRLARLAALRLGDKGRAARAYEGVLKVQPDFEEAKSFLSEFYSSEERWDELVGLYERELGAKDNSSSEQLGDMLQIAMLHWKKRQRAQDAEVWFEKVRKLEPAHPLMLSFYREYAGQLDDDARLIDVLQNAQRVMKEGPEKRAISSELAKLAEGQKNAQRAIEQYKSVLRQDPDNAEAREALKRLYKQTQSHNALVELLRQQLERTPVDQYPVRLEILREVATVYRQYIKSDTALVSVLNQVVQLDEKLDEHDVNEMRELVGLYEKLGRFRDLLTNQLKLAEITPDIEEKKTLYRTAARRWLEQFSNVQNATEAYEALIKVAPEDREARERLHELYNKRRAWPALYELYQSELESLQGESRLRALKEMAQLAAERLGRPEDAVRLYREIVTADPTRLDALDALEKHAERSKDWKTLADALERRVDVSSDDTTKLNVLQKLGTVYADQLSDTNAAARAWKRILQLQPHHHRALRVLRDTYLQAGDYEGLTELYATQNDWEGLAEVLSGAADRVKDPTAKIDLSYRAASVYVDRLSQPDRAFRSFERILAADPSDARAARALIPLYEKDEKWARLPALYDLVYEHTEDEATRLELLAKQVDVTGTRLNDRRAAVAYARKAYELAPASETALQLLERAARAAGAWEQLVESLETRLASVTTGAAPAAEGKKRSKKRKKTGEETGAERAVPGPEERRLRLLLARVYAEELSSVDRAIDTYKQILDQDPTDEEAATSLERMLRRTDRRDDLRWLLDLRVRHTPSDNDRVRLLKDWALLEEDVFEAPERSVAIYRRVLEIEGSDSDALRALPRLLLGQGDAEGAVQVIEQHRDRAAEGLRETLDAQLAELYASRVNDPGRALDAAVRALGTGGESAQRAVAVLEGLLTQPSTRARAAAILGEHYGSAGDARRQANALSALLDETQDRGERLDLSRRLARVYEERLGAYGTALDVMLRAVRQFPEELELWDHAEELAIRAGRPTDLAEAYREALHVEFSPAVQIELCERAARLHEDRLGDPIGATPYLEKVLTLEPSSERAFQRLKDILTAAERWSELQGLYDRAVQATQDASRRTDLLIEVALICEEITEEPQKATRYYERILDIDPLHETSLRALDRLYVRQERHADLAELLERRLTSAAGDELLELKLRLARVQLERLHHPELAIVHVADVLGARINDYQARELAERMLDIGSLRVRAAGVLEAVYESRDEMRDLVRVLEIRLEAYKPVGSDESEVAAEPEREHERRDLLRRIAELRDERLHDNEGALATLAQLVPADPVDTAARERLLEVGRRLNAHQRVAEVLAKAADRADNAALKAEILMKVAHIYETQLSDKARAEDNYERVMALDPSDALLVLPAAQALENIYVGSGEHQKLRDVLRTQVRLESDGDRKRDLLGRLGELCAGTLNDNEGAIAAWVQRLEEHSTDADALAALDELYQRTERWRELVDVLERRRDIADQPEARRTLLVRIAGTQSDKLQDPPRAIESWRGVLDEFGPNVAVLEALERLYEQTERWDDLAEIYDAHLNIAENDADRLSLLARLGDLRREHQRDLDGALDAYRRALTIDPSHAPSRHALERLFESPDVSARREATNILLPIYELEGEHEKLLRVLDIQHEVSDDPFARVELLEKAATVAERSIGDKQRAYSYAERAARTAVGHVELGPRLSRLEQLADATNRQADHVRLLCEIAPQIFEGDMQLAVTLKVAELARHRLADRELARQYYQKALELRSDDRGALAALESLYDETGDARSLLDVLERRIEVAEDEDERKLLMYRRARLLAEVLGEKARAISAYEAILDLRLETSAVEPLRALYSEQERFSDLLALYQRELDAGAGTPADLRVEMSRILATRLNDVARALDELEEALSADRQHAGAIAELEKVLTESADAEARARAATLLEPVYLARADYAKLMSAIQARLAFTEDVDERRELLRRLAQLYEEQAEDYVAALDTTAKLLHQDLADAATQSELERLAKVAGAEARLASIYARELEQVGSDDPVTAKLAARTGELFAQIADFDAALVFYRRALAFDPESRGLFAAIDDILKRTDRHEQRVQLYREALELRFDPAERSKLLHTIADLERHQLGRVDDAIETYRAALDVDERDARALDALTELYRERTRYADLAELYLRRAEHADGPVQAAEYRLALALLLQNEQGDSERAIDQLEEIVRSLPTHPEAIKQLERLRETPAHKERVVDILRPLYEAADDWRHLIKLNEDRFALGRTTADKVDVLRETARLWEDRGSDRGRARRALSIAFELDPNEADVRVEYERLVRETSAFDELARTYSAVLDEQPDVASRREILAVLAQTHDKERDDPRSALIAYGKLYDTDPSDAEPLAKMEQLATLLSDWPTLVKVLTARAELTLDGEERASLWRRVGEAKRDMLDDAAGATQAYERALEDDPESSFTVDCLIDLYESRSEPARLVELYLRRVELASDDDAELKYTLLMSAAKTLENRLNEPGRAIEVLSQALTVRPGDSEALELQNRLYRRERMWHELLDNLRLEAGSATAAADRARLRREIGEIYASELSQYEDAVEAYRLVIEEQPEDEAAIAAVTRIGREHEELRDNVASILIPALRQTGRHQELVQALELRLSTQTEPSERAETLRAAAEVLERQLNRAEDAQAMLLRALAETPDQDQLHADVERLSDPSGWNRYSDALLERAQATFDPDTARDLYTRLGRISEERLKDDRRAVLAYDRALEHAGDQPELLEALDRLYSRLDESRPLSEVLERRLSIENVDARAAELNYRLGVLQLAKFDDRARALGFFRAALERAPEHESAAQELEKLTDQRDLFEEAAEVLENVYRTRGSTQSLAKLYEKRVSYATSAGERIQMRRDLARVLEDDVKDPAAAQRVLQQGLRDDASDASLLDEIERLSAITGDYRGAADALRDALSESHEVHGEAARDLYQRLARWYREHVKDEPAAEQALVKALEHDPTSDEVLGTIEELQRTPGRERDLIATLRRRAKLQLGDDRREEFYRQARELAERASDRELAEAVLRELLGFDDANLWALRELSLLREAAGDHRETVQLLLRRADLGGGGESAQELRHRAASLTRNELADSARATALYEQLFEEEPGDRAAARALRELHQSQQNWDALGRLLDRLVDIAETAAERSELRLELARLHEQRFGSTDRAIDLLREVLYDDPAHSEAVVRLSELLERTERDEELAELLGAQIEAARARGDIDAELKFQVRLGEIYDTRLSDRSRAIDTYRSVLERSPGHRGALEALARLLRASGDLRGAADTLERVLEQSQGQEAVSAAATLADIYGELQDSDGVTRALERGLAAEPTNGVLRERLHKQFEAGQRWDKLAELLASNVEYANGADQKVRLLRDAARIRSQRLNEHDAAAELLARASELKPDDREILLNLCEEYNASGRGKDAAQVLERIVESYGGKRSKELADIHRRLADAYLADDQKQRALEELDKAFRIEPGNISVLKRLGEVALDAGDFKKAQQMFRALLLQKLEGDAPITKAEVFYYLGETHLRLEERAKAVQMYERAVQQDDRFERAKVRLQELKT